MFVAAEDVRRGLENDEFMPFFQPLVSLQNGQLAGFEVLARWRHPIRGMIPPDKFIPVAERDGWIGDLTHILLDKAFSAAAQIPDPLTLAFNVSPLQLRDLSLPKQIQSAAETLGFPLHRVSIEITESALVDNLEAAQTIAQELKALGCKIALDDFGTGYSSLLHLHSLPFDELKVDRSFVSSMVRRRESRKIVSAVVGLGQSLGLTTVAEGVEHMDQAEMLMWLGCELGQGWLFGKPVAAEYLPAVIAMPREKVPEGNPQTLWSELSWNASPSQRLAQLQAVFDGAPVGLAFLNRDLRYVNLNQRLADLNGAPVAQHLGKTVAEMIPDLFPRFEGYIRRALQGEAISGVEVTTPATDRRGEEVRLLSYQPARDEAGEVIGVSVAIVDITEGKRAEAALRESEHHYRHMVELNPQIPWVTDAEGNTISVSSRWEDITGQTPEQTKGHGWLDAAHPDDRPRILEVVRRCLSTGDPLDLECRVSRDGKEWHWVRSRGAPRRDAEGRIIRWYGSVEIIDDYKHALEELRRNQAQLQAIFDAVPVGIILASAPDGKLVMANPEARRIIRDPVSSYSLADYSKWGAISVKGRHIETSEYPLTRALRGEKTRIEEALCLRADGTEVWLSLLGAPILREDGTVEGGVVVLQDIDDLRLERQRLFSLAETLIRDLRDRT